MDLRKDFTEIIKQKGGRAENIRGGDENLVVFLTNDLHDGQKKYVVSIHRYMLGIDVNVAKPLREMPDRAMLMEKINDFNSRNPDKMTLDEDAIVLSGHYPDTDDIEVVARMFETYIQRAEDQFTKILPENQFLDMMIRAAMDHQMFE